MAITQVYCLFCTTASHAMSAASPIVISDSDDDDTLPLHLLRSSRSKSGFRGVHELKGKWAAQVYDGRQTVNLGFFNTKIEAARAVSSARYEQQQHKLRQP